MRRGETVGRKKSLLLLAEKCGFLHELGSTQFLLLQFALLRFLFSSNLGFKLVGLGQFFNLVQT